MAYAKKKAAAKAEMERKMNGGKAVKNTPKKKGGGWATVKKKMNIPTPRYIDPKQTEMEFRNAVLKMMKSENSLLMMEEARKKKMKEVVREKTEFEIVKERLKHIEFSDEEKGFLTPEQMEIVKQGVMLAKDELAEMERDAKGSGQSLDSYVKKYPAWDVEIKELKEMGVNVDLSNLLQARKRSIIRNLFYDPQADEKRRLAEEERERLRKEREAEQEAAKLREQAERQRLLEEEKERLRIEREASEAELRAMEEERKRALQQEEEKLNEYAREQEAKQRELEATRLDAEKESRDKRQRMLRKFSTCTDAPDLADLDPRLVGKLNYDMPNNEFNKDLNDVGKLNNPFEGDGNVKASRRKNVGKLNNPFDNVNKDPSPTPKKQRRASKVGKLNSPFDQPGSTGYSRNSSRRSSVSSRGSSRRGSDFDIMEDSGVSASFLQEMNSAMQGLADLAANAKDDDQWNRKSSNNSDED